MSILAEIIVSIFVIVGGAFALIGSVGLVKLRDTMQRLHAPTKSATLGVGCILIASMLYFLLLKGHLSFHEILIALFILLTAPITANFISKVFIQGNKSAKDLPETGADHGWAVYDEPPR
ncbi:UNVERIFIED_CONTAM: hypothetical protein GTU68_066797 [Idotea baltica]|nr:hypothetical protein [Idotea baltica]